MGREMKQKKNSILVYHHYDPLLQLLEIFLSRSYSVDMATTKLEELRNGLSLLPHVILFDIQKTELDELHVIHCLKAENRSTPPYIIAIGLIEDREAALKAGADGFIPAYFDLQYVEKEVDRVINN